MSVSQLSVFVENRPGHLADTLGVLAQGMVEVSSFTIADTADYGILRLIVGDPEKAKTLLSAAGYAVVDHPVVCAVLPDGPGSLAKVARLVSEPGLDIEYIYMGADGTLLLRAEEPQQLEDLLLANGVQVLGPGPMAS